MTAYSRTVMARLTQGQPEPKPKQKPKRKRARDEEGQFRGDDPATPLVDEAWVEE